MRTDILILGAGVTGLAAGVELKESAVILEKDDRPGGLVRSKCFDGGYWFDNVLHLLHFKDSEIQARIEEMLGPTLRTCPPEAWIVSNEGIVKYPFQLNLGGLNEIARINCLADYAKTYYNNKSEAINNYKDYLQQTFGSSMCELFYFPYNEKLYKFPLEEISCSKILWNLHQPSFEEVLKGGFSPNRVQETYNTNAFYPRPPKDAAIRGMETLSIALSQRACPIELNCNIVSIDPPTKTVWALKDGKKEKYAYESACLTTIPLPNTIKMCSNAPDNLLKQVNRLQHTNVVSIAISIQGPRPKNTGLWRYYTDKSLPFTRLIFMTEFDPLNAPSDGWALLAEVPVNGKEKILNYENLITEVIHGVRSLELLNNACHVIGKHAWINSPAYVVFTLETEEIIRSCMEFLAQYGITSLGRYGNWEYSSMYQNIKSGFDWARKYSR